MLHVTVNERICGDLGNPGGNGVVNWKVPPKAQFRSTPQSRNSHRIPARSPLDLDWCCHISVVISNNKETTPLMSYHWWNSSGYHIISYQMDLKAKLWIWVSRPSVLTVKSDDSPFSLKCILTHDCLCWTAVIFLFREFFIALFTCLIKEDRRMLFCNTWVTFFEKQAQNN